MGWEEYGLPPALLLHTVPRSFTGCLSKTPLSPPSRCLLITTLGEGADEKTQGLSWGTGSSVRSRENE